MRYLVPFVIIASCFFRCKEVDQKSLGQESPTSEINCSDAGCTGTYSGPEFIDGSDIAHQFSNEMSGVVGDKLKELYRNEAYSKVDFPKMRMTTQGMGCGHVVFRLSVPFVLVQDKCDAYTSFDHVGGWNHAPALSKRVAELSKVLMRGDSLNISDLKTTPEGLQEYWIQWRNETTQSICE